MSELSERRASGIFCNRTLNLRSIRAIGYDMDYTLIHYHVDVWEERAFAHARDSLIARGWPLAELRFDPTTVIRGLVLDLDLGNIVKANRFGYVHRAAHGTRTLEFEERRTAYSRTVVDLRDPRWVFLNTLFSHSEASLFAQLVDLLDAGRLPGVLGYPALYEAVRLGLDAAHLEGRLKAEIVADPERFVDLDPDVPLTLMDQRAAGKKLLLITNSEWPYTRDMMAWAFDRFLPDGTTWRDLFDLVVVSARKPGFFDAQHAMFEVVDEEGLLRPVVGDLRPGGRYLGGSAAAIEAHLGLSGSEILYVGDHIFTDVNLSKRHLSWRTALVLRELEDEIAWLQGFEDSQAELTRLMAGKAPLELEQARVRLDLQRLSRGYGPRPARDRGALLTRLEALKQQIAALDAELGPLARASSELGSARWGLLLRAGNDKSHLARQVERHADIYLARVSDFLRHTPHLYLRSPRSSLPHDP